MLRLLHIDSTAAGALLTGPDRHSKTQLFDIRDLGEEEEEYDREEEEECDAASN